MVSDPCTDQFVVGIDPDFQLGAGFEIRSDPAFPLRQLPAEGSLKQDLSGRDIGEKNIHIAGNTGFFHKFQCNGFCFPGSDNDFIVKVPGGSFGGDEDLISDLHRLCCGVVDLECNVMISLCIIAHAGEADNGSCNSKFHRVHVVNIGKNSGFVERTLLSGEVPGACKLEVPILIPFSGLDTHFFQGDPCFNGPEFVFYRGLCLDFRVPVSGNLCADSAVDHRIENIKRDICRVEDQVIKSFSAFGHEKEFHTIVDGDLTVPFLEPFFQFDFRFRIGQFALTCQIKILTVDRGKTLCLTGCQKRRVVGYHTEVFKGSGIFVGADFAIHNRCFFRERDRRDCLRG